MMLHVIIVHFHELSLKGKNRSWFEKILLKNIKRHLFNLPYKRIRILFGRIVIENINITLWNQYNRVLSDLIGIRNFILTLQTPLDIEQIKTASLKACKSEYILGSFRVSARRQNKNFVYKEEDEPAPLDNYGKSKLEAEKILSSSFSKEPMGYVILRAPLVYGQNVKGNLKNLMQYIYKGLPLPIPQEDNRRSMIGIENLCDAMIRCAFCEKATKNIFLVSDDVVVSTRYLFNEIA